MFSNRVPVFYFPTKVYLIDDNIDFLTNFSLQLNPAVSYNLYDSPHAALRELLQENKISQLTQQIFSSSQDGNDNPITNQMVKLDVSLIHKEIFNPRRFDEPTVIVVDYDMPGINGLELCSKLRNHHVKKILLTGKADERLAITAFNEGLIDQFVQKNEDNIVTTINESVAKLQLKYFLEATDVILRMLETESAKFLRDPAFINLFNKLYSDHGLVEHYITETTGSFVMLDAYAKPSWLAAKYYSDLNLHYEIAKDSGAPQAALDGLRSGDRIPYSWNTKDYYQVEGDAWLEQLHPAEELKGENDIYYYAYIQKLASFDISPGEILSYHEYLLRLGQEGRFIK
ncbi:MAG: response regulator [Gammaproteobacteria bacterium]|nr:response regulator [Gammaproteobacteria bacterium]